MKRLFIIILVVVVVILLIVLSGFAINKNVGTINLMHSDKSVLNMPLKLSYNKYLEVKIFYKGNFQRHYVAKGKGNPIDYLGHLNADFPQALANLKKEYDIQKKEPYCQYEGEGRFVYFEGNDGLEIDINALALLIIEKISASVSVNVVVPYDNISTDTTYQDLLTRTQKIASFSTNYSTSSMGRKNNINVAVQRINNSVIDASGLFSFNQVVGERSIENGFSMAKIIQNGEFVEGIGGGVCQVSTTLFNACLLAGLNIEKSATHSLPVSYVAPSLDAMVSSSTDLVIENNTPYPIYIYGHCDGNNLNFEIFGYSCGYEIRLRHQTIREIVCTDYEIIALEPIPDGTNFSFVVGKTPKNGLVSQSFRDYYQGNQLVHSQMLRRSVYAPQKGIKYKIPEMEQIQELE